MDWITQGRSHARFAEDPPACQAVRGEPGHEIEAWVLVVWAEGGGNQGGGRVDPVVNAETSSHNPGEVERDPLRANNFVHRRVRSRT